ncbi:MAG: hypothetical protein FIA95_16715 [Gemmatimonadetes bacterium]|nr:hypothetical protein [Gemmatimonadota bacterium]
MSGGARPGSPSFRPSPGSNRAGEVVHGRDTAGAAVLRAPPGGQSARPGVSGRGLGRPGGRRRDNRPGSRGAPRLPVPGGRGTRAPREEGEGARRGEARRGRPRDREGADVNLDFGEPRPVDLGRLELLEQPLGAGRHRGRGHRGAAGHRRRRRVLSEA